MSHIGNATRALQTSLGRLADVGLNVHHAGQTWLAWARPGDTEINVLNADGLVVSHPVRTWTFARDQWTRDDIVLTPDKTTRLVELDRDGLTHTWRLAYPGTEHAWTWWDAARSALVLHCTQIANPAS